MKTYFKENSGYLGKKHLDFDKMIWFLDFLLKA